MIEILIALGFEIQFRKWKMVFRGFVLSERQNAIMAHLYSLKDTPCARAFSDYLLCKYKIFQPDIPDKENWQTNSNFSSTRF